MERCLKRGFFDRHKREDIMEYREIFVKKMKSLLPYFVEFEEDDKILLKEYPSDCATVKRCLKVSQLITNHYYLKRKKMLSVNGRSSGSAMCGVMCRLRIGRGQIVQW